MCKYLIISLMIGQTVFALQSSIGVFGKYESSLYSGVSPKLRGLPFFRFATDDFEWNMLDLKQTLIKQKRNSIKLGLKFRPFTVLDPADSTALSGMSKRKDGVYLSLEGKYSIMFLSFSSEVNKELIKHHGLSIKVGAGPSLMLKRLSSDFLPIILGLNYHMTYYSKDYLGYFFGVSPDEATANRNKYAPSSTTEKSLEAYARYIISKNWFFLLKVEHTFIASEKRNSPIVDKESLTESLAILSYTF